MLWGLTIDPVKPLKYTVQQDIHVSFAIVDCRDGGHSKQLLHLAAQHGDDDEHLLCTFIVGYVFHQNLNLKLTAGEEVTFIITGPNKVHLNGYTCTSECNDEQSGANEPSETQDDGTGKTVFADQRSLNRPCIEPRETEQQDEEHEGGMEDEQCQKVSDTMKVANLTRADEELLDATEQLEASMVACQERNKEFKNGSVEQTRCSQDNIEETAPSLKVIATEDTAMPSSEQDGEQDEEENTQEQDGQEEAEEQHQSTPAAGGDSTSSRRHSASDDSSEEGQEEAPLVMESKETVIFQEWEEPAKNGSPVLDDIPEIIILSTDDEENDAMKPDENYSNKEGASSYPIKPKKNKAKRRSRNLDKYDGKVKRKPKRRMTIKREKRRSKDGHRKEPESYSSDVEPEVTVLSDIIYPPERPQSLAGGSAVRCSCQHTDRHSSVLCKVCEIKPRVKTKTSPLSQSERRSRDSQTERSERAYPSARFKPFKTGKLTTTPPPSLNLKGSLQSIPKFTVRTSKRSRGKTSSTRPLCLVHGVELLLDSRLGKGPSCELCARRSSTIHKTPEQQITRIKKKKLAQYVKSKYSSKIFKIRKKEVHKTLTEKQTFYKCRYCRCSFTSRIGRRIHEELHANSEYSPT